MAAERSFLILAVDDNQLNLRLIEVALAKEGYKVITALDGLTGMGKAFNQHPDLILLDIKMPGKSGFDVIEELKNNASTTSIPVIFLTGVSDIEAKLKGFELGAVDYIIKPFHPLEVLARVRLHLKLSIATNSLISSQAQKLRQIKEAQTSMLPPPDLHPQAKFGVYYLALQEAGGDFYDVLEISNDIYGYFVADFSGHDIKTSYLVSAVKALLSQNCTPVYRPNESIKMMNDVLTEILPDGKYLTACYARLNRKTKEMSIISAGHPPAIYMPKQGQPHLIELDGDILGMFKDVYFERQVIKTSPGDRFFIYSDGLVESSKNKISRSKGALKLMSACIQTRDIPIKQVPYNIVKHIFSDIYEIEDDIIILSLEV